MVWVLIVGILINWLIVWMSTPNPAQAFGDLMVSFVPFIMIPIWLLRKIER